MVKDQKNLIDIKAVRRDAEANAALELMFGYYDCDEAPAVAHLRDASRKAA